jgi:hypothetical protein
MKKVIFVLSCYLFVLFNGVPGSGVKPQPAYASDGSKGTVEWHVSLVGKPIKGMVPQGEAAYSVGEDFQMFSAAVSNVPLPDGTLLVVYVKSVPMGNILLESGAGKIQITEKKGSPAMQIKSGDKVSVRTKDETTVLAGRF